MEPTDHDMYRAAIHGAFELFIRNMSRPLLQSPLARCKTARKRKTWCRTHLSKPGKHAGRCAIRRNFRPGSPPSYAIAPRHPDAPPDHSDGRAGSAEGDNDVTFKA